MKGDEPFVRRLASVSKADVAIPQPVIAELAYGLARLPRSRRRDELTRRFDVVRTELVRMPWSDEVSERYGTIKAALERRGDRIEDFDAAIAAHALAAGAVLVSANVRHMARVTGLTVEDWSR